MNCPFYSHNLVMNHGGARPIILIDTSGNQCALIADAIAPCQMEIEGKTPDWKECPRVGEIRLSMGRWL